MPTTEKIIGWPTLLELRAKARAADKIVVWTNGCFDLIHAGHIRNLQAARKMGDLLVVGVNSDTSVRRLKGVGRPIVPAGERVEILAALACVDHVIVFNEDTPLEAIRRLKPDIHCKGGDYAPPNGKPIPEAAIVETYGGRIKYLPMVPGASTSGLIGRIQGERCDSHAPSKTDAFASGKTVLVLGDVILDEYVTGDINRISPEAPVPVVELRSRSYVPGGAGNVAANIAAIGGRALVAGVVGADSDAQHLRDALAKAGVHADSLLVDTERPTTVKLRLLAHNQQIVRLDREVRTTISATLENSLLAWLEKNLTEADACILSDYGKGVLTSRVAQKAIAMCRAAGVPILVDPKSLNSRTWRGATLVKPNQHEVQRLINREIHDEASFLDAGRELASLLEDTAVLITRGALGMSLFRRGLDPFHIPTDARNVYDVTGAGDTVISTLAVALAANATIEQAVALASQSAAIAVGKHRVAFTMLRSVTSERPSLAALS